MKQFNNIDILFVTGFGPVVRDGESSRKFYIDSLGIDFKKESGGYLHTNKLNGINFFGLWPLSLAAESCFGTNVWPDEIPVPQSWLEFDVIDVQKASEQLKLQGYQLLVENQKEP